MSEAEKGWKCLANDAKISVTNWKKNTLNDFSTKKLKKNARFTTWIT